MKKLIISKAIVLTAIAGASLLSSGFTVNNRSKHSEIAKQKISRQTSVDLGEFTISGQNFEAWGDGSGNITAIDALNNNYLIIGPVSSFSGTYGTSPTLNVTATISYNNTFYSCKNLPTSF